jgi:ATP/maltotriose-dependent transcriptional regulator MalT
MAELTGRRLAAELPAPRRPLHAVPAVQAAAGPYAPIQTRFRPPRLLGECVDRPALAERLSGATARLLLLAAPAGFGKTTLVAQWMAATAQRRPFAWVSIDEGDNDPARLWSDIIHALRRACPRFDGADLLADLQTPGCDVTAAVLPGVLNELAAAGAPAVLALDDFHAIREPACHEQIGFLLTHLPELMQLVIVTRAEPPLPVARWRARGELAEFRADDLRFGLGETAELVRNVAGLDVRVADLMVLLDRAEGWPAALYLAALALRGHPSPGAFIRGFGGRNKYVADFLAQEILERQPAGIRRFLLRTSILDRLCAPLCDAVAGSADADAVLRVLERDNLFVVPLDETRQWYRYHHLFAEMLRDKLAETEPGILTSLHVRASAWHRERGSADEAIGHALAAGDRAAAIGLIASQWHRYFAAGRARPVRGWLRALGDAAVGENPLAVQCAAWTAALSGDRQAVRRWLPALNAANWEGRLPDGMRSLSSSVAMLLGLSGDLQTAIESARTAVRLEDDPASPWYALARTELGFSLYLSGGLAEAEKHLRDALAGDAALPLVRLFGLSALGLVSVELGDLSRALRLVSEARGIVTSLDLGTFPSAAFAHVAVGAVYAALGRPKEARNALEFALGSRHQIPATSPWPTAEALLLLAHVLLDLDDRSGAGALAGELEAILASSPDGPARLSGRLAQLKHRLASSPPGALLGPPLTRTEVSVLRMLRSDLSLRDIARERHVSANTIKSHSRAIYRKLSASNRAEAVRRACDLGLV